MVGPGGGTVQFTPVVANPPTVTTTLPEVVPLGTGTIMLVAVQPVAVPALTPLKVTALLPWLDPKFVPVIVTAVPTEPALGDRLLLLGGTVTVNDTPLLA